MKKAIIAGLIVIALYILSALFKVDPTRTLITMIAYWVFLDRLEREDGKED